MKAVVLAAGLGQRLLPLTLCRAKAAVPYRNRPLVLHCLDRLAAAGVAEAVVNLHHLAGSVQRAIEGDPPAMEIRYSPEPEILGTAGALLPLRGWLGDEHFFLVNGKVVFDFDLAEVARSHLRSGALATLVLVAPPPGENFSSVYVGPGGGIAGFARTGALPGHAARVFTGIHAVSPGIWRYIPRAAFSDIVADVYRPALERGERLAAFDASGEWLEFSTLRRYLRFNVAGGCSPVGVSSGVSPAARLTDSVVWDHVKIGPGCRLDHCIVADGVEIPAGTSLDSVAVVDGRWATSVFERYLERGLIVYPLGARW